MRYRVTVNNETFNVDVERAPGSVRTVARYSYDASAYVPTKAIQPVLVASAPIEPPIASVLATPPSLPVSEVCDGTGSEILSPMPGTVWKVLVNVSDNVKKGQPVVILEAMKMEIDVAATADGVIDKICVTQGKTVNTSDLIAIIK